jgi:O-antigen ligase
MTNAPLTPVRVQSTSRFSVTIRRVMFGAMALFLASSFFSIAVNSLSLGLMGMTFVLLMVLERRLIARPTPLDWFFLAYILAEFLSAGFSPNPLQALEFSKRLLLIGIVYWFGTWVTTDTVAGRVMAVLLGSAVAVSLVGVWIMAASRPLRLGIFQFYMTTSELMMFAALMLLPFTVHPATPRRIRALALAGLVPVLVSLYGTVTKGAYLAFAAGMVFIALVRSWKLLLPALAAGVLLVVLAPPFVQERLEGIVDIHHPENAERLMLWKTGLRIFARSPVVGVGDIDLHAVYVQVMDPGDPARHGHLHNMALQFLVTLGVVGFAAVLAMFAQIVRTEWKIYRRVKDHWLRGSIALGALSVFVGLQVAGLTEWTFGDQEIAIVFWISVGMALAAGSMPAAAREV